MGLSRQEAEQQLLGADFFVRLAEVAGSSSSRKQQQCCRLAQQTGLPSFGHQSSSGCMKPGKQAENG
jgi:hypothetical protein